MLGLSWVIHLLMLRLRGLSPGATWLCLRGVSQAVGPVGVWIWAHVEVARVVLMAEVVVAVGLVVVEKDLTGY